MSDKDTRLIREIKLDNILSFGPDTRLELRNLNVLIGANGSGKSNLIDCIEILRSLPVDMLAGVRKIGGSADLVWKGSNANALEKIGVFIKIVDFVNDESFLLHNVIFSKHSYGNRILGEEIFLLDSNGMPTSPILFIGAWPKSKLAINFEGKYKIVEIEREKGDSILNDIDNYGFNLEISTLGITYKQIKIYRDWNFGRNTLFRTPQAADMPNDHLAEDFSNLGLYLNKLRRTPTVKKKVLEELKNIYDGIDDYDVKIEGNSVQVFFTEGEWTIPATRLSDGTLRYLCLLAILCDPDPPPLICIEEPELGLHPDILPGLTDLIIEASTRTQLIVTTHSDIIVEAMTDTPESVVVCEKHEGRTVFHRLTKEEIEPWLEQYRLGELWIDGHIGGKRW